LEGSSSGAGSTAGRHTGKAGRQADRRTGEAGRQSGQAGRQGRLAGRLTGNADRQGRQAGRQGRQCRQADKAGRIGKAVPDGAQRVSKWRWAASKWRLEEAGRAGRNAVRQTGKADRQGILGRQEGRRAGNWYTRQSDW
jgi:ribonuclease G